MSTAGERGEEKAQKDGAAPTRDVIASLDCVEIIILDHGFVRLIDCTPRIVPADSIGVESRIIDAARVCYGGGTKQLRTDLGLLSYLYRHEHMTPFEMVDFTFMVRVPMFVAKQHMRHRTFSYNEESARYSVIEDDIYLPMPKDVRAQSTKNRQGSDETKELDHGSATAFSESVNSLGMAAFTEYSAAIGKGVAKEMARIILPEGRYTKYYCKANLRNLLHFLELRMDSHAQQEIRVVADAMYALVRSVAPHAIQVFDTYTRGSMKLSVREVEALTKIMAGLRSGVKITSELPGLASKGEEQEWQEKLSKLMGESD